jgi:hypothetical protein
MQFSKVSFLGNLLYELTIALTLENFWQGVLRDDEKRVVATQNVVTTERQIRKELEEVTALYSKGAEVKVEYKMERLSPAALSASKGDTPATTTGNLPAIADIVPANKDSEKKEEQDDTPLTVQAGLVTISVYYYYVIT